MRRTREIKIGGVTIGGGRGIAIQSMLCARFDDVPGNVEQAMELERAGCEILRVAVPNLGSVKLIPAIKDKITIPLVADVHFDYRLAVESVRAGADKIRVNPGNIGGREKVKAVAEECAKRGVPIRIGVNGGSLEREILAKYGAPTAEAMAQSALYHASLLEELGFYDIVLSLKSSDVKTMIEAHRIVAGECDYPLHLGVTEAGTSRMGLIRSAVGIGALLLDGIGDTIRVTLTAPPVEEIYAARDILKAIGMHKKGVTIISCPTCGRTSIDIIGLTKRVEEALADVEEKLTVAVMGCVVNGPGEARCADVGICGGEDCAALFVNGKVVDKLEPDRIVQALKQRVEEIASQRRREHARIL